MAKKKKIEKVTSITTADEYGNAKTIKLTGNTGGYTRETTPALSAVGNNNKVQDIRTIKNSQNNTSDIRTIKTVEEADRNLKNAENNLNLKTAERQKKEAEIYEKAGQTFQTKFENPQKQTLTYDTKGQKKTALPEQKITPTQARKQLTKELGEEKEAYDQWKWANYENNLAKVNNEDVSLWDKTGGNVTRAIKDLISPLTQGEDLEVKDEKGNKTYLPSYNELKQEAVQKSYGDNLIGNIARTAGDITYGGSKILGSAAIDAVTGGMGGKALYWTDMATDNYKQVKNKGYSNKDAIKNTIISTGSEFLTEKLLGGVSKTLTGGKASELQNIISNSVGKVIKNPNVANVIGSMGSEGIEEFVQEWIGALNDKITLGEDTDIGELVQSSLYSALIGAGTGGIVTGSLSMVNPSFVGGNQNGNILNNNDTVVPDTNQIREIVEQKNNGEIDAEEANNRIADVQNGTYQQNQNNQAVIQEAQRQFDAIQQAEQAGQIDSQTANQERQAIINTVNQITQPQQETQERVVQETQQEENNNKTERVETPKIEVKNNVEVGKQYTYSNNGDTARYEVKEIKDDGNVVVEIKSSSDPKLIGKKYSLKGDNKSLTNAQEYKSNIKYEDLSKDLSATRYDKKMYAKAKNTDMDMSEYDKTMEFITPNRAGNYSKQQILTLAEELGKKSKATTGEELKQEAMNYWVNKEPFKKTDSKTKYLKMEDFLKSYYKGAGVGTKVETQETTQSETQKTTQEPSLKNAKNYYNRNLGKYTPGDAFESAIGEYQLRPEEAENLRDYTIKKYPDYADEINRRYNDLYEQEETTKIEEQSKEEPKVEQPKVEEKSKQEKGKSTDSIKEIRQEVEEKTNKTMSKHIETSSKATNTVEDIKNMNYDDIVYDEKTHKASQEQALRELEGKDIDTNINDIHAKFRGTERLTNVDSAKITELMKQTKSLADDAAKNNNNTEYNKRMEQFRTLKGDYAVALSESGQFTEYAKVIKELDPETQVDVLRKVIEKEQRRGNKKYEDVTLNEDLIKKYKEAKTDDERDAIMEEIKDDTARQIKITLADKANEFRFLSMLGNVKTHGRNIFGNVGMYSLQSFKDGVAAIGEDVYNKVSKNGLETRSKTLKPATKEVSKFVNEKVDSFMTDITNKYNESRGMKGDLEGRTKKFSDNNIIGKALNKVSDINSKALDLEDRYFSSKMTKQAMKGFLTANGIETNADIEAHPELVAQALDYALFKGKEATFHQDSTTATAIRNLRDKLYTGSGFSKLGGLAIDTTLPFVSTPANIAKNALEYTPIIGFGDINTQLKNAPDNMKANVFIDSLSKQFTGGALMAVGAYLASQGLVKGSGDDDKEDKTEASLGNASYSIKIGNSTYDLSWLSPTAIPFFEGVEVFNAYKKANSKGGIKATDTADLIDTMFGTLNPMTDMSVLQSIERVITSITYGGNAVKSAASTTFSSYLQQYIPTLLSQIAQVGDTKQRNTNTGGNVIEKTIDQIKYKIPGARNTLPEKVDVWGDTNKTAGNVPQRMFEAFLSPANRKDYKVDKTTKELERLARETDDTSMLPTVKNKKIRVNGEDHNLKGKDYVDLQKTYGKTAKKNLDKLTKSKAYKNADDNEKKSMVGKLYDYASYKAKENYAKKKGINFDSGNQTSFAMIDAFGIPYEKYVENQVSGNQGASDMLEKLNGAGLSKAQKGAVMNYYNRAYYVNEDELYDTLENSNLSEKQKELIRAKYEKNITDSERERYQRADNIGVDYDLYTNFRNFATKARGESRSGGPTKKQKVINWIQEQELTAEQKYNLYYDYINNQRIFSYYK